jgi:hypothetical protein
MFPVISRKRLIVTGVISAVTAAGAGGTVIAARSASSSIPLTQPQTATPPSPSPSPGAPAAKGKRKGGMPALHIGKVTAISSTSITVVDASGVSTAYTLSPKLKVVTFKHQTEAVSAIPVGELVVVVAGHQHGAKGPAASPTPAPAQPSQLIAVAIEDTGFKAG